MRGGIQKGVSYLHVMAVCVFSDITVRAIISYCVMREYMRKGLKQIVHLFIFCILLGLSVNRYFRC
jgi:hypothetical protein